MVLCGKGEVDLSTAFINEYTPGNHPSHELCDAHLVVSVNGQLHVTLA